ncbi:MAG: N-acetyl-gamma-glutamyl-phosphate reductase [Aliidiomarina sp.]|uniref:N-acetyl-gamma-glutamyl-phosphate reductase n=1 Tax=Aliidiomarina sp. TaxID=1872439 RepID=UPI0025BD33BB|nr:N-acetyl-gamma-glutamyl-phosphate reductase [Aliidiomarina sp.]MCH8500311.1 N-acetyl-gamma-glutamyl-phosphate reductase [Aliidiomarina sp.]
MYKAESSQQFNTKPESPLRVAVFGASGYSGSELLALLQHHEHFTVVKAYASERAQTVAWAALAPQLAGRSNLLIEPFLGDFTALNDIDVAFLALPHEASAELAKVLIGQNIKVFDLSGAFRFKDAAQFAATYGFTHPAPELLPLANYMLAEFPQELSQLPLFSIPGCYPTAASLALLPVCESGLLAPASVPVITAISGVSGAGRAANLRTSFCEVSVQPYGVFQHRHRPEIANNLERDVVFTPLIGPYPRGIVATCVAQLRPQVNAEQVHAVYQKAYAQQPFVRLVAQPPAVQHVAHTPFCDIFVAVEEQQLIVIAALDNLLKGAASQAVQAANRVCGLAVNAGFERHLGLSGGA